MKYLLLILLISISFCVKAQDPLFTNSNGSLIALNPSFAGSNSGIRYQSILRNQWINLSGTYFTLYNSFDAFIKPIKGGVSFGYLRDSQARGTLITNRYDFSYAQHLSFYDGDLKIIPSVQFSYLQLQLDRSKLNFGDMIDARRGFVWNTGQEIISYKSAIDLSSGLIVNYKHFYIGGSYFHINQPDIGLEQVYKLPPLLSLFTSYNFKLGEKYLIQGLFRLEQQQNFYRSHIAINAVLYKHLILGVGFQNQNAYVFNVGYRHNYFTVMAGFDAVYSKLSSNTAGSYEIMASFNLRNKDNRTLMTDFEKW